MSSYLYQRGHSRFLLGPVSGLCTITSTAVGLAEAVAYKTRVEADGGTVISFADVVAALAAAKVNDYYTSIRAWYSAQFGVKKDGGTGAVSKLYDLSSNSNDVIQATSSAQPVWTANQQNGLAGIVGGSGKHLSFSNKGILRNIASASVAAVVKRTGASPLYNGIIFNAETASSAVGRMLLYSANSSEVFSAGGRRLDADTGSYLTGGGATTDTVLLCVNGLYSSSDLYLYKNGSLLDSTTSWKTDGNTQDTDSYAISLMGMPSSATQTYFPGVLLELIVTVPAIVDSRTAVETHLNSRWAVY